MGKQLVLLRGDDHRTVAVSLDFLHHTDRIRISQQTFFCLFWFILLNFSNYLCRIFTLCHADEMLHGLTVHISFFSLHLCDDLIDLVLQLLFILHDFQPVKKLCKGRCRIGDHRFHRIDFFQRIINPYRIVDLKMCLMDRWTQAGCTAHHLLKEDPAFDTAHEYQCGNLRDINSCGKQVNRDRNTWITFIFESLDGFLNLFPIAASHTSGDLHNGIIVHAIFGI